MNAATSSHATVAGGRENTAMDFYATVGGGYGNTATARDTFIGGGIRNLTSGSRSVVSGGVQNQATAPDTVIAGGAYNQASDDYAFVGGGTRNLATGYASVIRGGAGNVASLDQATVSGGLGNQVAGKYGTIGGGYGNEMLGNYAAIPGGFENKVNGDYGFAAGYRAVISAENPEAFVFADASEVEFPSVATNEFAVRATGGVRFVSAVDADGEVISGVQLAPGSGSWASLSNQSAKNGISRVDKQEILALVADLSISSWSYNGQNESIRHLGPMSEDFYAAFGLGGDEHFISSVDADGVALAAIQGMYEIIQIQESQIQVQNEQLAELETRLGEIERMGYAYQSPKQGQIHGLGWGLLIGFSVLSIWKKG